MALPPKLEAELESLRRNYEIDVVEDADIINFVFKLFPLGDGYNVAQSDLLIRIPRTYPEAAPDMFWVHKDVALTSGAVPQAAENIESYVNREWRRFSWHWQKPWNPNIDNMQAYVEFVNRRLREKR